MKNVKYFNTEREAEKAKRKFKKYNATKTYKWVVQGNALVRIPKFKKYNATKTYKWVVQGNARVRIPKISNKGVIKKKMKKWGKIGAPHSQKRKNWLRRMRSARKGIVLKHKGKGTKARKGIVLKRKVSPRRKKRSRR